LSEIAVFPNKCGNLYAYQYAGDTDIRDDSFGIGWSIIVDEALLLGKGYAS